MRIDRTVVLAALAAVCFTTAVPCAHASTAAEQCRGSKIKAVGAAIYGESNCYRKALAASSSVDADCLASADGKLASAFTKAVAKGGCDGSENSGDAQNDVDACIAGYADAIGGDPACTAAKIKAVGRKTSAKAKCWQKGILAGTTADAGCLSKAESTFDAAIAKADLLGTCTDTAAALESMVDDCVTNLTGTCALAHNTEPSGLESPDGCALLERDTSGCEADRVAAGLGGYWLKFSCRVTLTKSGTAVTAKSDGQPDYLSNYFSSSNACHETYTGGIQNPNTISAQSYTVSFPLSPNTTPQTMMGIAVVGLAVNGVPVFGNFAAPGDNIFDEAATFDRCGAHPQNAGKYHYHSEPYSITYDDSNFVGVMRDGYPIYGRRDPDNSLPTLDAQGGHTGVTVDSPSTPVYHYHVNEQVNPDNSADSQWFLTTGTFHGTPGSTCTNCN